MQKVCAVLGGAGFLGSHVVDDLLERGYRVRVFDSHPQVEAKNLAHLEGRIEYIHGDFLNAEDLSRALRNVDYVFHFVSATTPAESAFDPKQETLYTLKGTLRLLDLCVRHGVEKIIYPSSGGAVYGDTVDLAHETTTVNPLSPYAKTKLTIERYLGYYKRAHGLDYVVYRIANPYGERQNPENVQGVIPIFLKKMLLGETLTLYGSTVRDYIYVKDVTRFIAANFHKKNRFPIYNVGSGEGVSLLELVSRLERATGLTSRLELRDKRSFDVERIVLDCSRAKREFGFRALTTLEEGIQKTYKEVRRRYWKRTPVLTLWTTLTHREPIRK